MNTSATSIIQTPGEYRIRENRIAPSNYRAIDVVLVGDRYPIARASESEPGGRWFITCGPEFSRAVSDEFRFPPTLFVASDRDARTWLELLAELYVKATAR